MQDHLVPNHCITQTTFHKRSMEKKAVFREWLKMDLCALSITYVATSFVLVLFSCNAKNISNCLFIKIITTQTSNLRNIVTYKHSFYTNNQIHVCNIEKTKSTELVTGDRFTRTFYTLKNFFVTTNAFPERPWFSFILTKSP